MRIYIKYASHIRTFPHRPHFQNRYKSPINALNPTQSSTIPQLNEDITLNVPLLLSYTLSSLLEWGLMDTNLILQFKINNNNIIINIQDPHYMAIFMDETLKMCLESFQQNPWLFQLVTSHPWMPYQSLCPSPESVVVSKQDIYKYILINKENIKNFLQTQNLLHICN